MKKRLSIIAVLCCSICYGQEIFVRERIEKLNIPHKEEVVEHWISYAKAAQLGEPTNHLWLDESRDFLLNFIPDFYRCFNQTLSDLQFSEDEQYRLIIHAEHISERRTGATQGIDYQLNIVLTSQGWRLVNRFDIVKSRYKHYSTEHIDFYTLARPVTEEQLLLTEQYLAAFTSHYGVTMKERLTYIYCADSEARALSDIGIIKIYNGENGVVGARYLVNPHTIIAPSLPHFHELVHAVMIPNYPNAPLLLHEGIAVLEGETRKSKSHRRKEAIRYLSHNHIEFTTPEQLHALLKDNGIVYYAVASAIIEYCLNVFGAKSVIQLFESTEYDGIFEQLGIAPLERTKFVYGLFGIQK